MRRIDKAREFGRFVLRVRAAGQFWRGMQEIEAVMVAGDLAQWAEDLFRLGECGCNQELTARQQARHDRIVAKMESCAETIGYKVRWPGLWPELVRKGTTEENEHLDDVMRIAELP